MEAVLTVRLDQETKNKGTKVMKDLGLTPSQAVRRLFDYTVSHDCLPFDLDPNSLIKMSRIELLRSIAAIPKNLSV